MLTLTIGEMLEQGASQFDTGVRVFWISDKIIHLVRIDAKIIKFLGVPDTMILDILDAIAPGTREWDAVERLILSLVGMDGQ